ncbi:MAG TPA: diacylglycerol kinase family protein [Vicinamibacterales bacterium]|nr:diacylglycerol kinase family protein [Vicinamibacterales bacterium]
MRAHLIVNPSSGTDRAVEMLPLMRSRLGALFEDLIVTVTAGADDLKKAAARTVAENCAALYVAGGDGTVNGALRGVLESSARPAIPIGIIPCGTGNDFSKALGLGDEPEPALDRLLDPHVVAADVGMMNDRPFINTSAGGLIAETSEVVTPALKDVAGKVAYLIGGARALVAAEPLNVRLLVASERPAAGPLPELLPVGESAVQLFAVCNAPFIGGGYAIAPNALIDDGLLDVIVVPRMPVLELLGTLQRIAASGEPGRDDVMSFRSARFDLVFDRRARVNIDGEVLEVDRCVYRVRSGGASFFCGPEPRAAAAPVPFAGWQRGHQ